MKPHPHAALMAEYAKDAAETETPWERWECRHGCGPWQIIAHDPLWCKQYEYRRKPRTIRIGEFDVPEPVREPLEVGATYYVAVLTSNAASHMRWGGSTSEMDWLRRGLIHLTREAAELHTKALLSFTATKPNT